MQNNKYLFTSESVSEGHPDKVCDRISDMVVDSYLSKDPVSRVACETLTTTNKVVLAGEVRGPEIKEKDLIDSTHEASLSKGVICDLGAEKACILHLCSIWKLPLRMRRLLSLV